MDSNVNSTTPLTTTTKERKVPTCRRCHAFGHNIRTCKVIELPNETQSSSTEPRSTVDDRPKTPYALRQSFPGGKYEAQRELRRAGWVGGLTDKSGWIPSKSRAETTRRELDCIEYLMTEWKQNGIKADADWWWPHLSTSTNLPVRFKKLMHQ